MRTLLALPFLIVVATSAHAQDYRHNAWGLIAAPMSYNLIEGYEFEVNDSNTSLDFGLFYTRFFTPSWSGRFDVFLLERDLFTVAAVSNLTSIDAAYFSVEEKTVQADMVVNGDRRIDLAGREARFTAGLGLMLAGIYDETISRPTDSPQAGDPRSGTYFKWGWLAEAGMTLAVDPGFGVFARFRMQQDEDTFGASSDADIRRELAAYGFHVGAEFGF